MKKIIIFALFLLWGCGCGYVNREGVVAPTATMPNLANIDFIEIYTVDELMNIRNGLDKSYRLMNDIDMSEYKEKIKYVTPLSNDNRSVEAFTGVFDGNGHKIISSTTLFLSIRGGVVMNLTLEDTSGHFAGYVGNSMIINCHSSGTANSIIFASGLIGHAVNSIISGCSSSADVTSKSAEYARGYLRSGCLIGTMKNSELIDSYCTGDVIGMPSDKHEGYIEIGGLVGIASNSVLRNVYSTGNVTLIPNYKSPGISRSLHVGGIVGVLENSEIDGAYSTGNISGRDRVGGIAGIASRSKISNAYSSGEIRAFSAGGIAGVMYKTVLDNVSRKGPMPEPLSVYAAPHMSEIGNEMNEPYSPYRNKQLY